MSGSLLLAAAWIVLACLLAMALRRQQGMTISVLIVLGIPVAGWITLQHGPVLGMAAIAMGACLMRWPLLRLMRALRG